MTNTAFARQRSLFKAYDIRGEAVLFTPRFQYALAHAFARHYLNAKAQCVVIGHDARSICQQLAHTFATVFTQYQLKIQWLGLVTTPIMAFWAHRHDGMGIMCTASHSPANTGGVKWLTHHHSPSQAQVLDLFNILKDVTVDGDSTSPIEYTDVHNYALTQYQNTLLAICIKLCPRGKLIDTLVIDCLNGATAVVAEPIFSAIANKVIMLNNTPDGTFPKGNPDPAEPHRLGELQRTVFAYDADLGIAFDGDGDRVAIVDSTGALLSFDDLLCLLALASMKGGTHKQSALFDVKCLHTLPATLAQYSNGQLQGIMTKTGSSHLRAALQGEHKHALFAGELSGHFIFNDGHFICHDDGIYAALRLIIWLNHQNTPLHVINKRLPKPIATPDLYIDIRELTLWQPSEFVNQLTASITPLVNARTKLTTLDGVRLDFNNGFGLVRSSNTSKSLTVRFGANNTDAFDTIVNTFLKAIDTLPYNDQQQLSAFCQRLHQAIFNSLTG